MSRDDLTLSARLSPERVFLGLPGGDRFEVLDALSTRAEELGLVADHKAFYRNLRARELEMSTALGKGLAAPHAEVAGASESFVLAAVLDEPVDYDAIDGEPVDIVFLIGGRPGEVGLQLQLLARIARLARKPGFLSSLKARMDAGDFVKALKDAERELYAD